MDQFQKGKPLPFVVLHINIFGLLFFDNLKLFSSFKISLIE